MGILYNYMSIVLQYMIISKEFQFTPKKIYRHTMISIILKHQKS